MPRRPPPAKGAWWALPSEEALASLGSSPRGLEAEEAARRLLAQGPNEVARQSGRHALRIALGQFTSPLILVLIGSALVARLLGEGLEALVILAIVGVNALLGFLQEYRAERAVRELRRLISNTARVRRGGVEREVPARELVAGDVVVLEIGDIVPADLRLLAVDDLATDESTLTGESLPVEKRAEAVSEAAGPHERRSMAFTGTAVASGYGSGVVVATGEATALGRTAAALAEPHAETDFQRNIRRFSDFLLRVIVGLTVFVFAVNALLGKGVFDSLLFALALAVGITPEALPVIVTLALSHGARRMAREQVVTKRLMSVEDLGNVDTLCCDKTGTLTEGAVRLDSAVDAAGGESGEVAVLALVCGAPANALDRAIEASAAAAAVEAERRSWTELDRNEFDYERRRMSVLARGPGGTELIVKGAPESVLPLCDRLAGEGGAALDAARRSAVEGRVESWERRGYRVLAVARRAHQAGTSNAAEESALALAGFLLFLDPPKADARASLAALRALGVGLKVLSGDSAAVTRRICQEVGLEAPDDRVVTGDELRGLDEAEVARWAQRYAIFARVSPEQKQQLVRSLATEGHIVGFLGDGVNDAPGLRAADVGIAVDSGSGIAKEAADIILLRKDLGVLARGITEGRKTFANITKYILNTISANFGNMTTVALSSLFLRFIPLLPSQILLNNLLSDGPLLTISTDRVDASWLRRPRRWSVELIARFMVWFGLLSVVFDLALIVALQQGLGVSIAAFRTAWFVESACSEILVTFAVRTRLRFSRSRPSPLLIVSSALGILAAGALPFTALGQRWFAFVPLPPAAAGLVVTILGGYFLSAELLKGWLFRRLEAAS